VFILEAQTEVETGPLVRNSFEHCPVVWDTGASYGLTPFRSDFIDCQDVCILVQDIAHTNYVVGVGTVMWKMTASNGDTIYLPIYCYHLPSADIRLLSPQSYHQLHPGRSGLEQDGTMVEMHLPQQGPGHPSHIISIPVETDGTNLPVIYNCHCTQKDRKVIGPRMRTGLFRTSLDMRESWKAAQTAQIKSEVGLTRHWNSDIDNFEYEYGVMQQICCTCVGDNANTNLTGPQRELLLWHWKSGCSTKRIQQMMV